MSKRKYYPLLPSNGGYKEPGNIAYLSIYSTWHSEFICSSAVYQGIIYEFANSQEVVDFIISLPSAAWIITYNIEHVCGLFNALINTFDKITGFERNAAMLTLITGDSNYYLIDIRQFFGDSLGRAAKKLGMNFSEVDELDQEKATSKAIIIMSVFLLMAGLLSSKLNIYPSKSPGATAIKSLRKFISEPIKARGKPLTKFNFIAINPPALHWLPGFFEHAYMYDINACYPSVMRVLRFPTNPRLFAGRPPDSDRWIATVKVNYTCDTWFSPAAVRLQDEDGLIVHPDSIKNHRMCLSYIDAMTLQICGKLEITQWIEGVCWKAEDEIDLFSGWVDTIEELSQDYQTRYILKIISRSLHSKFSQKSGNITEIIRIEAKDIKALVASGKLLDYYALEDGGLAAKITRNSKATFRPYIRPDWEALIMSAARFIIYSSIDDYTVYIDTDCIISTQPRPDLSIGDGFGQWKLSSEGQCYIAGPRLYLLDDKAKSSGINTMDRKALARAIMKASDGEGSRLRAIQYPSLFAGNKDQDDNDFTINLIKYPIAEITGNNAFVTRSPTIKMRTKKIPRILTSLHS